MAEEEGLNDFDMNYNSASNFLKEMIWPGGAHITVGLKLSNGWEEKKISFLKFVKEEIKINVVKPLEIENMDEVPCIIQHTRISFSRFCWR